jgi:hypothetical protein
LNGVGKLFLGNASHLGKLRFEGSNILVIGFGDVI